MRHLAIVLLSCGLTAPAQVPGRADLEGGRYLKALSEADGILARQPGDAQAWAVKSQALTAMMRLGEGLGAANQALALNPGLGEALLARAQAKAGLAIQQRSLSSLRHASAALGDLQAAVKADPGLVLGWFTLGLAYQQLPGILGGSTRKALECADQLRRVNPARADVLAGTVLMLAERWREAEPYFGRALALAPGEGMVIYGYLEALGSREAGKALGASEQARRLVAEARRLSSQAQGKARAIEAVSLALLDGGQPEEAWLVAVRALGSVDQPSILRAQLGKVAARSGVHPEEGLQYLATALSQPLEGGLGGPQALHWRRGQILLRQGRRAEAGAAAQEALRLDPNHRGALELERLSR